MKEIWHEFWIDTPIGPEKDVVEVKIEHVLVVGESSGQLTRAVIGGKAFRRISTLRAVGLAILVRPGKNSQEQDFGLWQPLTEILNNGLGSRCDFFRAVDDRIVGVVTVIGSDEQGHDFWRLAVEFAVGQVP